MIRTKKSVYMQGDKAIIVDNTNRYYMVISCKAVYEVSGGFEIDDDGPIAMIHFDDVDAGLHSENDPPCKKLLLTLARALKDAH